MKIVEKKLNLNSNAYNDSNSSIKYWQNNRNSLKDLYPSEKYFLEGILQDVDLVLDVGCAAGGGFNFCREANESVKYTGIDISKKLIEIAGEKYKKGSFFHYDGHGIPFKDNSFGLVYSFGVMHHLVHYENMIEQMINKSKRYILFDLRLSYNKTLNNPKKFFQKVYFENKVENNFVIPYIVININTFKNFIKDVFDDTNYRIEVFGYYRKPTRLSNIPYKSIYMCSIKIDKKSHAPGVFIDIPRA